MKSRQYKICIYWAGHPNFEHVAAPMPSYPGKHGYLERLFVIIIITRRRASTSMYVLANIISRSRYVAIAMQPVHRLQICPIVHNQGTFPTTSPNYIRVRQQCRHAAADRQTDRHTDRHQTDTQTRVTTIHFASSTTHAQGRIQSKQGPVQTKMWGPSLIYEYRLTEFTRHAQ